MRGHLNPILAVPDLDPAARKGERTVLPDVGVGAFQERAVGHIFGGKRLQPLAIDDLDLQ